MAAARAGAQRHDGHDAHPVDAPALAVEHHVRAATLRRELRPHPLRRHHRPATEARRPGTRHYAVRHLLLRLRLEYLEHDPRRLSVGSCYPIPERSLPLSRRDACIRGASHVLLGPAHHRLGGGHKLLLARFSHSRGSFGGRRLRRFIHNPPFLQRGLDDQGMAVPVSSHVGGRHHDDVDRSMLAPQPSVYAFRHR